MPAPKTTIALAVALAWMLSLGACTASNSPRGVADRFIDAYYVTIDLATAAAVSSGLALDKINQEIALTKG
ncbi:MAG: hypothetical protein ACREQB_12010, partial [Candidatus Binataceae bacterium]